jgi:DNA-binding MarR family transcriptional regulator
MVSENAIPKEIEHLGIALRKSHLLRIAGFADAIDRFIDIQLKDKVNWLKTLALTILIAEGGGTMTPSELGRHMLRSTDNTTKLVDVLVEGGLVKRYRRGKDRRNVQIKVTPAGMSFMTQVLADIESEGKLIQASMNSAELKKLETLTSTLIHQLIEEIRSRD